MATPSKRSKNEKCSDESESEYEDLESPTKSPNDDRVYKVIQLKANGLQALLISDLACSEENQGKIKRNKNCVDLKIEEFNRDVLGIPSTTTPDSADSEESRKKDPVPTTPSTTCNIDNKATVRERNLKHAPGCTCDVQTVRQ